MKHNIW